LRTTREAIVVATPTHPTRTAVDEQHATGRSPDSIRELLETLRSHYQERLHRRSDDYAATHELRSIERALAALPRSDRS
jgi:hypothetical protein